MRATMVTFHLLLWNFIKFIFAPQTVIMRELIESNRIIVFSKNEINSGISHLTQFWIFVFKWYKYFCYAPVREFVFFF